MSRLWIFSDLHQDWADNAWDPSPHAPTFDIAIVAGDLHLHSRADYRIGATRVVCNPRGHIEEDSAKTFDPSFTIDIPTA